MRMVLPALQKRRWLIFDAFGRPWAAVGRFMLVLVLVLVLGSRSEADVNKCLVR